MSRPTGLLFFWDQVAIAALAVWVWLVSLTSLAVGMPRREAMDSIAAAACRHRERCGCPACGEVRRAVWRVYRVEGR